MPLTPERIAKLRAFGLSEYASRTYLALLDLGTAEARDISGISKVPASKIYRILEQLHEKGLVAILPEFPRKYAPIPFEEFLEKIHDEHRAAARAIEEERDELVEMFAVVGATEASDRGTFTVLRGRRNVLDKIDELAHGAEESLLVVASPGLLQRASHLAGVLRAARERGVAVRLLGATATGLPPELADAGDVRVLSRTPLPDGTAAIVADRTRAFVIHFLPDDGHAYDGKDTAVYTDQAGMVGLLDALFAWPWAAAHPTGAKGIPVREADAVRDAA